MAVKIGSVVKLYTVLLLSEKPRHGYDLMKGLEERLGGKISASQIYPFLSILEKNKLIRIEAKGERDKKIYILTGSGKKFVTKFLERSGDLLQIAIEPKLTVCAHCGCKVYAGGHREKINGKERTFCCCHCAGSFKKTLE